MARLEFGLGASFFFGKFFQLISFFVPSHILWEGFVGSGSHLFVIPVYLFCFGCSSPWESTQFAPKDFQADISFAGCAALVLLLAVDLDVFYGQGLISLASSDGFQMTPFGSLSGRFLSSQVFFHARCGVEFHVLFPLSVS